jgi:Domain of unknown function (DUF5606)
MEYSKIIAITGLPGLFELISSKSDGGIVRSLDDKSTRFVSSRVHQFSHLESIEVYTVRHNVNLVDVLKAMESSKEKLPDDKDSSGLKSYFEKVYPELDFDRVYASDLKKMAKWFSVLAKNGVEIKLSETVTEKEEEETVVEVKEEKPAKKTAEPKAEIKSTADKQPTKKTAEKKEDVKSTADKKQSKKTAEPKSADTKSKNKAGVKNEPATVKSAKKAEPAAAKKTDAKPASKKPVTKKK